MKEDIPEWEKYVPKSVLNAGCEKLFPLVRFSSQEEMHRSLGFSLAMQVRMLFSCLVDADFLATEAFMNPVRSKERCLLAGKYFGTDERSPGRVSFQ